MQPSELEIQREVETLRDIRRRSTAQNGILDPDLPSVSGDPGSSTAYWEDSSSSSHGDESDSGSAGREDPFSPFWVPARLHPEIAPAEFRQFLKEHARAPAEEAALERSSSTESASLSRKKSMLSRQYDPTKDGGSNENEHVVPMRRNRSIYGHQGPQLTISDLQKLEELAEEASQSRDPSKLRSVLRRSISLNVAPSVIDQMDDMPDLGDDADAPIIVPRPGQILRRTARTKIRKSGTGEGPHRFKYDRSRRGTPSRAATIEPRTSSDFSSSDHGDDTPSRKRADSDIPDLPAFGNRPDSYSEESSIYDAYAREESEESEPHGPLLVASPESPEFSVSDTAALPPKPLLPQPAAEPPAEPVLHHPQPKRALSLPVPESAAPLVHSPSPELISTSPVASPAIETPAPVQQPQQQQRPVLSPQAASSQPHPQPPSSPSPSEHKREKDKKGLFGKWGGDKSGKKGHNHQKDKAEKESRFFGSLFGGKKKQEDTVPPISGGNTGRETAAALLGASKSAKSYVPSPSPQPMQGYARYPIHVERAIYRLSHIKLANPRRPLYEQVLISNLMFWYLGVINKSPTPASPAASNAQAPATNGTADKENEHVDKEKQEKEERERIEKERQEKEREKERERANEQKRRGSLTKQPASGAPGGRRAEVPVRGPQYDMQHRAIEQEYGYPGGGPPRTSSAPPTPYTRGPSTAPAPYTVQLVQPQPQPSANRYYVPAAAPQSYPMMQPGAQQLPPVSGMPLRAGTSPSPPAGQRYTPAQEKQPYSGPGRAPGRSLSASATAPMPQQRQNGVLRKGNSAHAVMPRQSEEEDVPLAVYQQRRK
ncbi:uncharacterized protein PHACADRAFT_264778 [Phanerochaete carnosa HHB-10118-sp]|uniref:Protein Zds1 C-terminal domain-containing protein n=1 Tax=Phanerochaete carnosa (strain HHB-10118-sp) TaxID=650164 RepID=K5VUD1_PHACS|nr:uncharacterized protein PHACADRAFT_264778 [Phanerochaete carnosa HHB-10118-sp]EKM50189.1 hypothetical protein PHACADRAFT_264778 [Phanerochaete carnosa HHB-10118-sp]